MNKIYLDNAATTPVTRPVLDKMLPYFSEVYGNASGIYATGREARKALEEARRVIAGVINAKPNEIYFTAGGSESDNWAIRGAALAHAGKGKHIITTVIEHHAVLHTCAFLERRGYEVTYLPVDEYGAVSVKDVESAMRPDTILVSIMAANNEIGTLEPIAEIGALCRERGILFHTDAVQMVGSLPVDVAQMRVDMLSASAHKFHGPKGIGFLYVRAGVRLDNLIQGGAQERGRRAGTENLPGAVGMAEALRLAAAGMEERRKRVSRLRDKLISGILAAVPETRLNGHPTLRLPGNVNVSIRYIEGEAMLLRLDMAGIAASSGSACTSGSLDPSHVLLAIGLPHEIAHGSLRFSLSDMTTEEEIDEVLSLLPGIIQNLRDMSPLYEERNK